MSVSTIISGKFVNLTHVAELVMGRKSFFASPVVQAEIEQGIVNKESISKGIKESFSLSGWPKTEYGGFRTASGAYYWKIWAQERPDNAIRRAMIHRSKRALVNLDEMQQGVQYERLIFVNKDAEEQLTAPHSHMLPR